ncbi:MAG: alpha/beta hydrolase [Acidimicrobiales bacterium]
MIIKGAEPYSADAGPLGVLVLHGFTGNPGSMRGLAKALAGAGYGVELPLLPGHGTEVADMIDLGWGDWLGAAEQALAHLASRCARVAVAGLSMGGSLACALAIRHPEIACLVLVNPLVQVPHEEFRRVVRETLASGTQVFPGIGSDIAFPGVVESAYPETPLRALLSLFEGVESFSADLGSIACPILLFSSRQDHVVPSESGDLLVQSAGTSVERVWLDRSFHVATLDFDRQVIEDGALDFVNRYLSGQERSAALVNE